MARIADKHGLTNLYRENGHKRVVKRGRPRTRLFSTPKMSRRRRSYTYNKTYNTPVTPIDKKTGMGCLLATIIFVILIIAIIVLVSKTSKKQPLEVNLITLDVLCATDHPMLFDDYNIIKEYYTEYDNFLVEYPSASSKANIDNIVLRIYKTSVHDTIREITFNFSALSADEKSKLDFEKAVEIVLDYIPVDLILKYFVFDKAIQVEREDHISYELYYRKNENVQNNMTSEEYSQLHDQHGFSIVIKEYYDGNYLVEIDSLWYEYVYDTDPAWGVATSEEEIARHQDWDCSLEELSSQYCN